jgi:uncharacterized protein YidB (DUF937 family)
MSLLTSIIGGLFGGQSSTGSQQIVSVIHQLIQQQGGLQGLMSQFGQKGLGDLFSSWVGTGENLPVQASQLENIFGSEKINQLASQLGLDPAQATQIASKLIPSVVDQLTPNGQIDATQNLETKLGEILPSVLKTHLGSLLS